jgi:L-lactate utilization protein LutB
MENEKIEKLKKEFEKRNIEMFYCESADDGKKKIFELMDNFAKSKGKEHKDVTVSWGGSVTLHEIGVKDECEAIGYNVLNPYKYETAEEQEKAKKLALISDIFLCGANAVTESGEIVNIDGNGNRVAAMIYGPDMVIISTGVNKIVPNVVEAYKRVKDIACPKNAVRLSKNTPCAKTGKCNDCFINGQTICSHTVITRRFSAPGRVKIVIIDENLGY